VFHPTDDCENPFLYLPDTGIAEQERAISGSCQQNLSDICNSIWVWWLILGWISRWGSLWIVHPFVLAPNFVSVFVFKGEENLWIPTKLKKIRLRQKRSPE
jgi:hypothetical protein